MPSLSRLIDRLQEITLLVNPDPQSLWKDIPSDQTDPYAKPDMAPPQLCPGTGRTLVAASRRGRSHAHVGAFRDDDYALHADPNSGWHVLAVADGAGSAQYSRRGSQLAVQTSVRFVAEQLATSQGEDLERAVEAHHTSSIRDLVYDVLGGAAHASVKAIQAEAKRINTPVKDFSTTLPYYSLLIKRWRQVSLLRLTGLAMATVVNSQVKRAFWITLR